MIILALLLALAAPKEYVKVAMPDAEVVAKRGQKLDIVVNFTVLAGYHINAAKPKQEYLIPTRVEWAPSALKHVEDKFPAPDLKEFGFSPGEKLAVYQGTQKMTATFTVPANAAPGKMTIEGKLKYQACDDHACYPPGTAFVTVPVEIKK